MIIMNNIRNNKPYYYNDTPGAPSEAKKREWLAIRKKAGRGIDPETAEVMYVPGCAFDPYYIEPPELFEEEGRLVGRLYFARSPGSDIWVWFGDLPRATDKALWEKYKARLSWPAGLCCGINVGQGRVISPVQCEAADKELADECEKIREYLRKN